MKFAIGMQHSAVGNLFSRVVSSAGLITAVAFAVSACGGDSAPAPIVVGTLTISPAAPTVPDGRTTKLTVEVKATNGQVLTDRQVKWTSGTPTVATISDSGVVTGVSVGSSIITATSEGKTATVPITVTLNPCNVTLAIPIVPNTTVNGTLAATDCDYGDGTYLDAYNFVLSASTTVDVLMRSTAFDAFIFVYRRTSTDSLILMGDDDDSGGGNDARLSGLLNAGNYYILANSINVGGFGAYSLLLTSPFTGLNAGSSLFSSSSNPGVSLRRLNAAEARSFRGLPRRR